MAPAFAPVDRRTHLDGLRASLRADVRAMRAVQVRAGRTLLEIRRAGDPLFFAATTFPIFCESAGLSPAEARDLTAMAEAAETSPQVAARVLAARITPQKAAVVQQLLRSPELQRPGEDVLGLVESLCARDLIREVKRRKEQARLGEPPVLLSIQVSVRGRDDFLRCETLVSRSLDRAASEGETLERISDEYLQGHDPERKALVTEARRPRRRSPEPETAAAGTTGVGHRRSRHVPASDARELLRAAGDRCWVAGCANEAFLQSAHRVPFRTSGPNRSDNLLRLCRQHHQQFDGGLWWPTVRRDGGVVLVDIRGVIVGRLRDEAAAFVAQVSDTG